MRKVRRRMGEIARLFAVLLVVLGLGIRQAAFATATGVQCSTATVKTIAIPVRTKCGCTIGYRAPKPGEKGFVQCRCSEKRAVAPSAPAPVAALAAIPAPVFPSRPFVPESFVLRSRSPRDPAPPLMRPPVVG